jgi:lipopolysaccharide transport system ATP-binding protein
MGIAIRLNHISKEYQLGVINYDLFYKDLQAAIARLRGRKDPHAKIEGDHRGDHSRQFWALKDVSFDVAAGERIGIIGANGSGKSTLLKIISRITAPTEGNVQIRGRTASLLEVGTGFHPELTGRENIYLNGAILGMKRKEISRKMDEIVAFSEISEFIDTPVKRYSSGMYVRLAFSVSAHLETDIIVADEVLAVGDTAFQRKSLSKMKEISLNKGRTILFVSHALAMVQELCPKCVLLGKGRVLKLGETSEVMAEYNRILAGV